MTPDNDERDPLESWLADEIRPLPPPSGTFELITRRARRRKLRRLAVTVTSAAAVVAAVAVAVPSVTALSATRRPPATGVPVAAGSKPQASTAPQPEGSAQPTPSSSSSSSPVSGETTPLSGPVPANFSPVSVTFVSTQAGWVIGQAGTPGDCATQYCTSIARTDTAGQSWVGVPAPLAGAADGATGVSEIRFLDGVNGWVFGPELWATHDAGRAWEQISTGGQRVTDLETAGNRAYALFASCSGSGMGADADCTSYTLMTTTAGSDDWTPVGAATSGLANGGAATSAVLALTGSGGYLLAPDGTLYSGPLGGTWQPVGKAPCQPGTPQASGLPASAFFALVSSQRLALACSGQSAASQPRVFMSDDGGTAWTLSSAAWPVAGSAFIMASLTAAPNGTLVLATTTGTYLLANGASQWQQVPGTPQGGFGYVGMTTDTQGVAVPANASLHEIWMTFDGGLTWTAYPIS
jgi:hypothetical protein